MRKLIVLAALLVGCSQTPQQALVTQTPVAEATQSSTATPLPAATTVAPGGDATATPVAAPPTAEATPAPASTDTPAGATPAAGGQPFSFGPVRLAVPPGLPSTASGRSVPAANVTENDPSWARLPAYTAVELSGYPVAGLGGEAAINVYPVAEFTKINPDAGQQIDSLKRLLAERPQDPAGPLPLLPPAGAAPQFQARFDYVEFEGGAGIRYLTRFVQNAAPITNEGLVYVFQGITADGGHYISALLPVSAPAVVGDGASAFPDPSASDFLQRYETYVQDISAQLGVAPAQEIAPGLDALDALIGSIGIQGEA
ncbi:MAG TPA: hypothetical protein VFS21_36790 [Roseiflexaceae bacterium]|nr:hypothetical protein [Roseiflexaceae bacterium]